jgi:hypothetical protein
MVVQDVGKKDFLNFLIVILVAKLKEVVSQCILFVKYILFVKRKFIMVNYQLNYQENNVIKIMILLFYHLHKKFLSYFGNYKKLTSSAKDSYTVSFSKVCNSRICSCSRIKNHLHCYYSRGRTC